MTEAAVSSQNHLLKWIFYAGVVTAVTAGALQNPWIITILGGLTVVAVTALIAWFQRKRAASYFFDIRCTPDDPNISHPKKTKKFNINRGQSLITLLMTPRSGGTMTTCDIRFQEKKYPLPIRWKNISDVDPKIISIDAVNITAWPTNQYKQSTNLVGGVDITPLAPIAVTGKKAIRMEIAIHAKRPFCGFISFHGEIDNTRYFGRRKAVVPFRLSLLPRREDEDYLAAVRKWRERELDLSFQFSTGDADHQYILVTNNGSDRRFWAESIVKSHRDSAKTPDSLSFKVPWASSNDRKEITLIKKGRSAKLLVATFHHDSYRKKTMKLRSSSGIFHEESWVVDNGPQTRPAYDLLIKFFGEGLEDHPIEQNIWIYPERTDGPLRIDNDAPDPKFPEPLQNDTTIQDFERLSIHENAPEILPIYDFNLQEATREELGFVTLVNTASKGATAPKDAYDISVRIEGYLDYQPRVDLIPRLLKGNEIKLRIVLEDRALSTMKEMLTKKADDVGRTQEELNPKVFLSASVTYRNSRHEWFQTTHEIHFDLWRQRIETKHIDLVRIKSQDVNS